MRILRYMWGRGTITPWLEMENWLDCLFVFHSACQWMCRVPSDPIRDLGHRGEVLWWIGDIKVEREYSFQTYSPWWRAVQSKYASFLVKSIEFWCLVFFRLLMLCIMLAVVWLGYYLCSHYIIVYIYSTLKRMGKKSLSNLLPLFEFVVVEC